MYTDYGQNFKNEDGFSEKLKIKTEKCFKQLVVVKLCPQDYVRHSNGCFFYWGNFSWSAERRVLVNWDICKS